MVFPKKKYRLISLFLMRLPTTSQQCPFDLTDQEHSMKMAYLLSCCISKNQLFIKNNLFIHKKGKLFLLQWLIYLFLAEGGIWEKQQSFAVCYNIFEMGQQCCSQEYADNKVYTNSRQSFYRKPVEAYQQIQKDVQNVRNFLPVDRVPKLHPQVIEIESKLKTFTPSNSFQAPEGITQPSAYAINNEGLIYDANSQWRDGLPNGKGRLIYKDGSLYTGYFSKGVPNGQGRFVSSQGWYYEGDIQKEQAEGRGIFVFQKIGYRYQGEWAADYPDGNGKQTWVKAGNISSYEGEFVHGQKHGNGKYKYGDEWEYEGGFSNNEMTSSKGTIRYKNGQVYTGDFKNGKKHGFGIYKWFDKSTFQGWYSEDRKQGHGKFRSADNKVFQGQWKNGKRQGRGVLIIGGKMYPGVWKNDLIEQSNDH